MAEAFAIAAASLQVCHLSAGLVSKISTLLAEAAEEPTFLQQALLQVQSLHDLAQLTHTSICHANADSHSNDTKQSTSSKWSFGHSWADQEVALCASVYVDKLSTTLFLPRLRPDHSSWKLRWHIQRADTFPFRLWIYRDLHYHS